MAAVLAALCSMVLTAGPASAAAAAPAVHQATAASAGSGTVLTGPNGMSPLRPAPLGSSGVGDINCRAGLYPIVISPYLVSILGTASCPVPVLYLQIKVTLYWNDNVWGYGTQTSTQYVGATASGPCLGGDFFGEWEVDVLWPAGVTGPTYYFGYSPHILVTC
jgi:hypothetical protein